MDLYLKGRATSDVLTSWDMFRIPFNKRYLINNQRYSLTGQPLMYIGSSIIDVMEELDVEKIEELKISAVQIPEEIKLYDLRNNIYEELNKVQTQMMLGVTGNTFKETFCIGQF